MGKVSAADLKKDPSVKRVEIRGSRYTLRELTIGEYDACVAAATEKRADPVTGRDEDAVNQQTLLRMMVAKSVTDANGRSLSISRQADIAMPVQVTLNRIVNDMHFPPTEGKDALWKEVEDDEPEEGDEVAKGEG